MKRGSNASEAKPAKKAKTSTDITSKLLKNIHDTMAKQLSTGKMTINPVAKSLPRHNNMDALRSSNPEEYFENIQSSLKALRNSIDDQRRAEKDEERMKLQKAQQLIDRMHREREEHRQKLKQDNRKEVLHRRLYSETTLNEMRQKLEERIVNKRMQIEERVKAIEERKVRRDEQVVSQEIEYWQQRRQAKQKAKSSTKLPALSTPTEENTILPTITRKGSLGTLPPSKQALQYEKQAARLMHLARMKQENIQLKQFEQSYSSRLNNIVRGHQNLQERLIAEPTLKSSQLLPSYNENRHKIMGNEFLKESLLLVRKNPSSSSPVPLVVEEDPLQLSAHEAQINKNLQVQALRERWARMLSKVRHGEITSEQGLELLNSIEKRLDKIDLAGVQTRLKQKYVVFSQQLPLNNTLAGAEMESEQLQT